LVSKGFGITTVYTLVISIYVPLPGNKPNEPVYTMILPMSLMKFEFQTYNLAQISCSCFSTQILYLHTDGLFDMTFVHTRRSYSRCLTDGVKRLTTQTCSYFHHQERLNCFTRNTNHHRAFLCTYCHF
jgi:hypothetical protein